MTNVVMNKLFKGLQHMVEFYPSNHANNQMSFIERMGDKEVKFMITVEQIKD